MSLVCPHCRGPVQIVGKFTVCAEHGPIEPVEGADQPVRASAGRPKVFISYGRKDARELVDRLCVDLTAAGFSVWRDTREIPAGTDWQAEIVDGLRSAQVVVAVMTPHSVRTSARSVDQTDSVCLGEIAYALFNPPPQPVVPVMAYSCEPPLAIYHLDYVDLCSWQASDNNYRTGLARLVDGIQAALRGEKRFRAWHHQLRPLDFAAFLYRKRQDFTGREWLFDRIDAWRTSSAGERSLLIKGNMGVGKSAIVAQLIHRNPDGQVLAYHCCQWDDDQSRMPGRFVQTIAGMIASKIDAYAHLLEHDPNLKDTLSEANCASDPQGAWQHGVLEQLEKLPAPDGAPRYLLIDALDEALLLPAGATLSIVDLLATRLDHLPGWLRVVATTRNHPDVVQRLKGLRAEELDAQASENLDDLRKYLAARLASPNLAERLAQAGVRADRVLQQLLARSEGNFLYAHLALEAIERDQLDVRHVEDLPPGLTGLYENRFRKEFPSPAAFAEPKLVLETMAAAQEPLDVGLLASATGLDPEEQLPAVLQRLATYLPKRPGLAGHDVYTFHHKSLSDWLTSKDQRGRVFFANVAAGCRRLAEMGWREYQHGLRQLSSYSRRFLPKHLVAAERWDDLERLLTDLAYYEARNAAGEGFQLATDLSAAWRGMPSDRPQRILIRLLNEALQRNIHFTHRHRESYPQALFQSIWNDAWWYDCPEAVHHYQSQGESADERQGEPKPKLYKLLEDWRRQREAREPSFVWARSLRPPVIPLGVFRMVLGGHTGAVNTVSVSTDGERLLSSADDGSARLWDTTTGQQLAQWQPGGHYVLSRMSPDSRHVVATVAMSHSLFHWDATTGRKVREFGPFPAPICCVAFSPDSQYMAAGSEIGTIHIYELRSGQEFVSWHAHGRRYEGERKVGDVAFSPDGERLASGGGWGCDDEGAVYVWDWRNGQELVRQPPHRTMVHRVAYSPDGSKIASCSGNVSGWRLHVSHAGTGQLLAEMKGHSASVDDAGFSPDGSQVISGSWDETVRIWSVLTGSQLQVIHTANKVNCVGFLPDGRRFYSAGYDNVVNIWDAGETISPSPTRPDFRDNIWRLVYSPDGRFLVTGSERGALRIWDALTGRMLGRLGQYSLPGPVNNLAFSPDNCRLAVATGHVPWADDDEPWNGREDYGIRIYDLMTRELVAELSEHGGKVEPRALHYSADGSAIVAPLEDGSVWVWDAHQFKLVDVLRQEKASEARRALPRPSSTPAGVWQARLEKPETVVVDTSTGRDVAWLAAPLYELTPHPSGHIWSGRTDEVKAHGDEARKVEMFCVEGLC
ncbi:MAG TPA: TIR domain-containing protein [Pirellulales bacterium]|jgi:WD40 repeat protein|nr:TIR domain-containing protein [Pirellulales bacterium]